MNKNIPPLKRTQKNKCKKDLSIQEIFQDMNQNKSIALSKHSKLSHKFNCIQSFKCKFYNRGIRILSKALLRKGFQVWWT